MSLLYWIVFGLIAGSIADFLVPSSQGGILGSIVLGIVGAIVGGYLGERFFGVGVSGFNLQSFVVAVLGSIFVIFLGRVLVRS
jgi:uncharacterized membrane protein YeaQ/YmgE (transglycosylase-associated protein family)